MGAGLQRYLNTLGVALRIDPVVRQQVLFELQSHLEERVKDLQAEGLSYEKAQEQAVRELGDVNKLAREMYLVHSKGSWREILIASLPHVLLAGLFAFHLWTRLTVLLFVVAGIALVSLHAWLRGKPKWTYPWLGYSMASTLLSWVLALVAVGSGLWYYLKTGDLPFSLPIFMLMMAYIPFSLWLFGNVIFRIVKQDWLLASLTALPFPFLTSWLLFLNWREGPFSSSQLAQASDGARALVFLALAVTTAVFFKMGHRLLQIALLSASTTLLVVFTLHALPIGVNGLAIILLAIASLAFLLSPAVLETTLFKKGTRSTSGDREQVVNQWFNTA